MRRLLWQGKEAQWWLGTPDSWVTSHVHLPFGQLDILDIPLAESLSLQLIMLAAVSSSLSWLLSLANMINWRFSDRTNNICTEMILN